MKRSLLYSFWATDKATKTLELELSFQLMKIKNKHDFGCFMIPKCLSGDRSFWDITGQQRWNWKRSVCGGPNPGDSWCICMWATANIVAEVGCDNVQINCSATDVDYVLR